MVSGTCSGHGAATQLACARCGTPICPRCLVRTPVGFRCSPCSGRSAAHSSRLAARVALAVLLTALVTAIRLGARYFTGRDSSRPPPEALAVEPAAGLGEEVRDGVLTFVAESFSCRDEPGVVPRDAPPIQACTLFLTGVNHGDAPAELFGRLQYVVDDAGRRYGPEEGIVEPFLEILNPEEAGRLTLVFFVPAGATIEGLEVHSYPGSLGARISLERNGLARWTAPS